VRWGRAWPRVLGYASPRVSGGFSVASPRSIRAVGLVDDDHYEALTRGGVAPGAGVVGVAELVVCGVEEPLKHHQSDTPKKSHSAYPCEVAGGSLLAEP
jgi:hypothetical protein